MNLSNSFAGGFISENGFYITYMLMTSLLLTSFSMAYSITLAALDKVLVAVRLLVPAFLLVLQFIGHATTAGRHIQSRFDRNLAHTGGDYPAGCCRSLSSM